MNNLSYYNSITCFYIIFFENNLFSAIKVTKNDYYIPFSRDFFLFIFVLNV